MMPMQWAELTDIRRWNFGTPYALNLVKDTLNWMRFSGRTRQAIVCNENWQQEFYSFSTGEVEGGNTRYFYDEEEAWNWLAEGGVEKSKCDYFFSTDSYIPIV